MSDRNRDPGAPVDSQGIPDYADASPERVGVPEPQRLPAPTEERAVATDFGTTAAEQHSGESLDRKLARENPDEVLNLPREDVDAPADERSPFERELRPADEDLAVHETLPGQIGGHLEGHLNDQIESHLDDQTEGHLEGRQVKGEIDGEVEADDLGLRS